MTDKSDKMTYKSDKRKESLKESPKDALKESQKDALKEAHKEDILHAAIAEFGRVGYELASTNEIVKNAGVSKGLLFHHFTNKQTLYKACQVYVMVKYGKYMDENLDLSSRDFFERTLNSLRLKMQFGCDNPEFLALINRAWHLEEDENSLKLTEAESIVLEATQMKLMDFFTDIDTSLFRDGVEIAKVIDYTRLALEASWVRFSHKHHNDGDAMAREMDNYFAEAEDIISLLRNGAYK